MGNVAGDTALQSDALEDLQAAVNYRRWLCSLALPHLGDDVLEIGSGLGDYAADWADLGVAITASEADHDRLSRLKERFGGDHRVAVRELAVPITDTAEHSAVVAYNVLEHIEDDVEALRQFAGLLRPGGNVVLFVPAFQFAMSQFDRQIGHWRRYTRRTLTQTMCAAGLDVQECHFVNMWGLLAWTVMCRLLRGRPKDGAMLRAYDRVYVPAERTIESKMRPPFGQSVFAVARRSP